MISFDNTDIAFKRLKNKDLLKAFLLFKTIGNSSLVRFGKKATEFAISSGFPVGWIIKPTIYSHFCGGETLDECIPVIEKLAEFNVKGILDYSAEGKEDEDEMLEAYEEVLMTISNAAGNPNIPFAVFKPTAFVNNEILEKVSNNSDLTSDEELEFKNFKSRINALCEYAANLDVPILIDAEDFAFQNAIDDTTTEMMAKYNIEKAIVYNTLQMYRHDRLHFLHDAYTKAIAGNYKLGLKFVRGAYMEKERERAEVFGYESPIHADKESTDIDFDAALQFSVENIGNVSVFCGTHNEKSCRFLVELMNRHNLEKNDRRIWFSQLYGMSDHISFNLAKAGYNVAKYIPYGPVGEVIPYLMRRAEENTSVAGQTTRELTLLTKERERRKTGTEEEIEFAEL